MDQIKKELPKLLSENRELMKEFKAATYKESFQKLLEQNRMLFDHIERTYVESENKEKMIAELATSIGVSICVEGIETVEQKNVLEGMKVRMIQGYYCDRPMKREDFEAKYMPDKN